MFWNFLVTKFQEKFNKRQFSNKIIELLDIIIILVNRKMIDNRTIQKFDSNCN